MKTITLKLTKKDINTIWGKTNSNTMEFFYLMECYDVNETLTHYECEVFDVDKFRKFLNDEMLHYFTIAEKESIRNTPLAIDNIRIHNSLKSILSKLDLYEYYKWYDEPKERIFKTEKELISFLRLNANEDATDEWLVDNSYQLGEWKKLDNGDILHRWESDGGVQNDEPKNETLKKLRDIVNWVEGKYDGDELREHMIVKTIKKELLS